jgi:hypothetical protein
MRWFESRKKLKMTMKKLIVSAGILAAGCVGTHQALAQQPPADKPWTISGALRGFYDDNYLTAPSSQPHPGSWGFDITPSASVLFDKEADKFSAAYYYDLKYYDNRPNNNYDQEHHFEASYRHNFNDTDSIKLGDSFVDSQQPDVGTVNGSVATGLQRVNGDNYHNRFLISGETSVTRLLALAYSYSMDWFDYTGSTPAALSNSVPYSASLNRFEHSATLDARYMIQPETTGVVGYQFTYVDHDNGGNLSPGVGGAGIPGKTIYTPPKSRNAYLNSFYLGLDESFSDNLKGSARAGLQYVDYYNKGLAPAGLSTPSTLSPYANLAVTYQYSETGNASLGFSQSHNQTDVSSTYDVESSTVFGSVSQVLSAISPDLTADGTASFQYASYNGGLSNNGSDKIYAVGIGLTYQLNKLVSLDARYNYDDLNSGVAGRSYSRDRIFAGIKASY